MPGLSRPARSGNFRCSCPRNHWRLPRNDRRSSECNTDHWNRPGRYRTLDRLCSDCRREWMSLFAMSRNRTRKPPWCTAAPGSPSLNIATHSCSCPRNRKSVRSGKSLASLPRRTYRSKHTRPDRNHHSRRRCCNYCLRSSSRRTRTDLMHCTPAPWGRPLCMSRRSHPRLRHTYRRSSAYSIERSLGSMRSTPRHQCSRRSR